MLSAMKRTTLSAKFTHVGARSATAVRSRALGARILGAKRAARDENVRAKRADFFTFSSEKVLDFLFLIL